MAAPPRWRLLDPALVWRAWPGEDERVVYSPLSAGVHLVNEAAWRLLQIVAAGPRTTAELAAALAADRGTPADEAFVAAVTATIEGLDTAGLLAPDFL